jgi:hypothetical protein
MGFRSETEKASLPASVAAVARPVIARLPCWSVIISWPVIGAVKVRVPRGRAVAGAAVVASAVIDTLAVVRLAIVALVEVVKQEGERKRDAPADLSFSWALGCKQQTARGKQNKKCFHGIHFKLGERSAHPILSAVKDSRSSQKREKRYASRMASWLPWQISPTRGSFAAARSFDARAPGCRFSARRCTFRSPSPGGDLDDSTYRNPRK